MKKTKREKNVLESLKENYDNLTGSQIAIGKYMMDHIEEVPFLSAIELGERAGFSDATIIRFARSIGYEGYSDLKNAIIAETRQIATPDERVLKSLSDLEESRDMGLQVAERDLKNLQAFLLEISIEKMEKTVELIYASDTIYFIGLHDGALAMDFLLMHMRRMGFKVVSITEGGLENIEKLGAVHEGDLLIAGSFPRYSKTTINAARFASEKGAAVISITDSELSPIGMKSDIAFVVETDNTGFFNSHIVTLELCNILLIKLLDKNKEFVYGNLKETIEGLEMFDMYL
jgi:DNA-binding MurR/RpiR family transcriptional regulator